MGAQSVTLKSVTDKRTDRQTNKKLNILVASKAAEIRAPTKLGMVIEDLEHVLARLKLLGVRRIVSQLGGPENLGETRRSQLKIHITP